MPKSLHSTIWPVGTTKKWLQKYKYGKEAKSIILQTGYKTFWSKWKKKCFMSRKNHLVRISRILSKFDQVLTVARVYSRALNAQSV